MAKEGREREKSEREENKSKKDSAKTIKMESTENLTIKKLDKITCESLRLDCSSSCNY